MEKKLWLLFCLCLGYGMVISAHAATTSKPVVLIIQDRVSGRTPSESNTPITLFARPLRWRERSDITVLNPNIRERTLEYRFSQTGIYDRVRIPLLDSASGYPRTLIAYYRLEPGDSIVVTLTDTAVQFSGRGSEMLRCQFRLFALLGKGYHRPGEKRPLSTSPEMLPFYSHKYDSVRTLIRNMVQEFAIPADRKAWLLAEFGSRPDEARFSGYLSSLSLNQVHWKTTGKYNEERYAIGNYRPEPIPRLADATVRQSVYYPVALFYEAMVVVRERKYRAGSADEPSFPELYEHISTGFQGETREVLLALLFSKMFYASDSTNPLLLQAFALTKEPLLKKIMAEYVERKLPDGAVYPFALPDANGNIVTLANLGGKVAIIDFWFTGCGACIELNKSMERVARHFQADTSVVFVNISADVSRERWLKSVAGGEYTHARSINLYTAGQGNDYPMLKYYTYQGYPKLLIVSPRGTLVSANAPRPVDEQSFRTFVQMIEKAKR